MYNMRTLETGTLLRGEQVLCRRLIGASLPEVAHFLRNSGQNGTCADPVSTVSDPETDHLARATNCGSGWSPERAEDLGAGSAPAF